MASQHAGPVSGAPLAGLFPSDARENFDDACYRFWPLRGYRCARGVRGLLELPEFLAGLAPTGHKAAILRVAEHGLSHRPAPLMASPGVVPSTNRKWGPRS